LSTLRQRTLDLTDEIANLNRRLDLRRPICDPTGLIEYKIGYAGDSITGDNLFDVLQVWFGLDCVYGKNRARLILRFKDTPVPLTVLGPEVGEDPPFWNAPGAFENGYGNDAWWLSEAFFEHTMSEGRWWRLGRQFEQYGLGILNNNERRAQQGIRLHYERWPAKPLAWDLFVGGSEYDWVLRRLDDPRLFVDFGDHYAFLRLAYNRPRFILGVNWLPDGVGGEYAASADLAWQWRKDHWLRYEYAKQWRHVNRPRWHGKNPPDAHMALVDVMKSKRFWLQGCWSSVDAEYDVQYTILHPFWEPFESVMIRDMLGWERWLYNPPALTNLTFLGFNVWGQIGSFPVRGTYYQVDKRSDWWSDSPIKSLAFDKLWAVWVYFPATKTVNLYLVYGQQLRSGNPIPGVTVPVGDQQLLMLGMQANF